jgi:hypothetical protein
MRRLILYVTYCARIVLLNNIMITFNKLKYYDNVFCIELSDIFVM